MEPFWIVWWIVWLAALLFVIFLWHRNQQVYAARGRVLDWCREAIGGPAGLWEQRMAAYHAMPSYDTMFWRFWVPVESFLPDEVRGKKRGE